jgi:hypothetical protein
MHFRQMNSLPFMHVIAKVKCVQREEELST